MQPSGPEPKNVTDSAAPARPMAHRLRTLGVLFGCCLVVNLPLQYASASVSGLWSGLCYTIFTFALYGLLNVRRPEDDWKFGMLTAVCMALVYSFLSTIVPHALGYSLAIVSGMPAGFWRGKIVRDNYASTRTIVWSFLLIGLLTVAVTFFSKQKFSPTVLITIAIIPIGYMCGQVFGVFLNRAVPGLYEIWTQLKTFGRVIAGYSFGYLFLSVVFANFYWAASKYDAHAFVGMASTDSYFEYWYFSLTSITTLGSSAFPNSRLSKSLVAFEVIIGIAWTVVVFAAALNAIQKPAVDKSVPNV